MDPKSIAKDPPKPDVIECDDSQVQVWEPPFERWQRLTEALIAEWHRVRDQGESPYRPS